MLKPRIPIINESGSLARGIVFNAAMFEGGGSGLLDISKYKTQCTFDNTLSSDWKKNVNGTCLNFGGTNQDVNCGPLPAQTNLSRNFSIFALINGASFGSANCIISRGNNGYCLTTNSGKVTVNKSQVSQVIQGNATLSANTWYWVGFTIDSASTANIVIYINGLVDKAGTSATTFTTGSNAMRIGCDIAVSTPVDFFNGLMSNVIIWNRALSPAEVKQLYTDPWQIYNRPTIQQQYNAPAAAAAASIANWINLSGVGQA